MPKIWINPAFKQQEDKKKVSEEKKITSPALDKKLLLSGKSKNLAKEFFQNLIDRKTHISVTFYDGTSEEGTLKWVDIQSICLEQDKGEIVYDSKNIMYYRS
ncbi:MAG: hypothetical protein ABRQ38_03455 [Candidatus Eremiobacterota bacterium]